MNKTAKLAAQLILVGLALGALGDALLRVAPWGLNAPLWTMLLLGGTVWLARVNHVDLRRGAGWMAVPVLLVAGCFAWRDTPPLKALDFATLCGLLAVAAWQAKGAQVVLVGAGELVWRLIQTCLSATLGYIPLFLSEVKWPEAPAQGWVRTVRSLVVGVLVALPLLMLFGTLLISADAVFSTLMAKLFNLDFSTMLSHLVPTAVCGWIAGGYLVGLLFCDQPIKLAQVHFWRLSSLEIGVALGLVNLLFFAFIVVQLRYLFGGANLVEITPGLTYATYARKGFFELVAVAAMALPMLLAVEWLLGAESRRGYRVQAAGMLLMLLLILASAWYRMRLYQAEFGWTQLRFYVTAIMAWLAVVLVWFALSVLPGRRDRFAFGALASGLVALVVLHIVNPDAAIARLNLAHARAGHKFDADYAARLSADAVPTLAAALPELGPGARELLTKRLSKWTKAEPEDWRTWSWGRAAAREAARQWLSSDAGRAAAPSPIDGSSNHPPLAGQQKASL